MIDSIFSFPSVRQRQKEAPLLAERELFLSHLLQQGCPPLQVRNVARVLLHVIRLMNLRTLREVHPAEVRMVGERWVHDTQPHITRPVGPNSADAVYYIARRWFRFHKVLIVPPRARKPYDDLFAQFMHAMENGRGLSPDTLRTYGSRIEKFLQWCDKHGITFASVHLTDVDRFLDEKRAAGWQPKTLAAQCQSLRTFFCYAEEHGLCRSGIKRGILSPSTGKYSDVPRCPAWKNVRRMLDAPRGNRATDLRTHAILCLCAIYALRSSEVTQLRLNDFDWFNETMVIRRAKRGRVQQHPIQYEAGEAILRYLREARPRCACRNLFVTLRPPFQQVRVSTAGSLIVKRAATLRIGEGRIHPHALRHACATELLRKGSSLKDIADFLGHRDLRTVSVYARYDVRTLRDVAAFSLAGVL